MSEEDRRRFAQTGGWRQFQPRPAPDPALKESPMPAATDPPTLDMTHVRHAVQAVLAAGADDAHAAVTGSGDNLCLLVILPSIGAVALFAASLTASMMHDAVAADSDLTPATAADRAAADATAIMTHADNSWEDRMADKGGVEAGRVLILYFPGVTITGATPEEMP